MGIRITIESFDPRTGTRMKTAQAEVAHKHAPAVRSAIDEIRQELGGRLEGQYPFATETAYTDAHIGVAAIAAAFNAVVPAGDAHYKAGGR